MVRNNILIRSLFSSTIRRFCALIAIALSLAVLVSCDQNDEPTYQQQLDFESLNAQRSSVLVDGDWLVSNLQAPELHILELGRTQNEFSEAHIPGAKFVDWREDISDPAKPDRYNLPPRRQFEQLMSSLGITPESTVVLYDTLDSRASARLFWIMKYYTHADVKVLDGGYTLWTVSGHPTSGETSKIKASDYVVSSIDSDLLVHFDYVNDNLASETVQLVDGRPFDQYTGDAAGKVFHTGVEHQRGGHIYGAQSVPWADNLREDGTFKSAEELAPLYEKHEVYDRGVVVTYCNEGLHAAMPWFVLHELLGYEDVRLYDDSMAEWGNVFDTPMVTGEHCM